MPVFYSAICIHELGTKSAKVLEELASHWRRRPPPRQYLLLGIIRVVSDRQFITPRVTTLARSNALLARKPVVGTHIVQQAGTKIARSAK